MYGYVYRTRNLLDGTYYIGQHIGAFTRKYLGSGLHLVRAVKLYGRDCFDVELIERASFREELDALEEHYILVHRSCGAKLYNISDYARRSFGDRISASKKGVVFTAQHRAALSAAHKGRPLSAEHARAAGMARRGRPHSKAHRAALRSAMLNSQKYRDAMLRRKRNPCKS